MTTHTTHTTESASKHTNGVDIAGLTQTVGAIRRDPALAIGRFRVRNRWIHGGHNRATIQSYYAAGEERQHDKSFVHDLDEPPVLLGADHGANPVEYALSALSGCITTTLVYHAAARGIKIHSVESTYEGEADLRGFLDLDPSVRPGFQNIRVTFKVDADATPEEIRSLVRFAKNHSPVHDMLSHGVPITVETTE
ncbi:MAG: OsmC family peroxiredoxin [Phycisphaera sp.]|nr:OsmC family peroxiredoxin [Phycisphaera sp.]